MKNVTESQLKKAIFMEFIDFNELVLSLTDGLHQAEFEFGLFYSPTDKAEEEENYFKGDIDTLLSEYFDVNVTSVHADDKDITGIWIVYK